MKHINRLKLIFLFLPILFSSCQKDLYQAREQTVEETARVRSSREYFERAVAENVTQGKRIQDWGWSPDEITPQWEEAVWKWDDEYQYLFVPLQNPYRYLARDYNFTGKGHPYATVLITQLWLYERIVAEITMPHT